MADLPITFSGSMVRAILREIETPGTGKTQTRRTMKNIKPVDNGTFHIHGAGGGAFGITEERIPEVGPDYVRIQPGDRLYVREHWWTEARWDAVAPHDLPKAAPIYPQTEPEPGCAGRFRQAMHMPKWASRITLIVTDVRVERLQDCSDADAIAEGIERKPYGHWKCYGDTPAPFGGAAPSVLAHGIGRVSADPIHSYATLWDSINGPGAWAANPWVAAYSFRPVIGNIDQIGGEE